MRKKITLLLLSMTCLSMLYAGGGWATSAVSITKNSSSAYLYPLNTQEGWTDGDWMLNTEFSAFNFGTPTSLVLNGASANGWTDDTPGYTTASFVLYYRVYKNGTTPGSWSQIALDNLAYNAGNNYVYSKSNANIDILALATLQGTNTYTLEVAMSKNQFYTGGSWNSMIPDGQSTAYASTNAGYKATFVKTIVTDIKQPVQNMTVTGSEGKLHANFEGVANIELYNMSGQLIDKQTAQNSYIHILKPGAYLMRFNGTTQKVIVH